eukprot:gene22009-15225_t
MRSPVEYGVSPAILELVSQVLQSSENVKVPSSPLSFPYVMESTDENGLRSYSYIQAAVTKGAISPEEREAPAPTATPMVVAHTADVGIPSTAPPATPMVVHEAKTEAAQTDACCITPWKVMIVILLAVLIVLSVVATFMPLYEVTLSTNSLAESGSPADAHALWQEALVVNVGAWSYWVTTKAAVQSTTEDEGSGEVEDAGEEPFLNATAMIYDFCAGGESPVGPLADQKKNYACTNVDLCNHALYQEDCPLLCAAKCPATSLLVPSSSAVENVQKYSRTCGADSSWTNGADQIDSYISLALANGKCSEMKAFAVLGCVILILLAVYMGCMAFGLVEETDKSAPGVLLVFTLAGLWLFCLWVAVTKITHQGAGCNELSMIGGGVDSNSSSLVVSADVTREHNCISNGSLAVDGKDACGIYEETCRMSGRAGHKIEICTQTDSSIQLDLDCSCKSAESLTQHEKCQKLFTPEWPYDGMFPPDKNAEDTEEEDDDA